MHYYISQDKPLPFQMCVYDEVTKVKNASSQRVNGGKRITKPKSIKMLPASSGKSYDELRSAGWTDYTMTRDGMANIKKEEYITFAGWKRIVPHLTFATGLTGTPAPNGYMDLHGQYYVIDGGKRLGVTMTQFKSNYFASDYMGWNHEITEAGRNSIETRISDITIKMDTTDYLELPDMIVNDIMLDFPANIRKQYDQVENDLFTALDDGTEIELFSKAAVSNKALQFCNGSPYKSPESHEFVALHDIKLNALDDIIEEAGGKPVLLAYSFKADAERIMKKYVKRKNFRAVNLTDEPANKTEQLIKEWCEGKIQLMIGHPASIGHGVDGLQEGGHIIVWFGLNWSLELYEQMWQRIRRQGQGHPVVMHRIMISDSLDIAVADALRRKDNDQEGLKRAIQRYRDGVIPRDGGMTFRR